MSEREALEALVAKLEAIGLNEQFKSVFTLAWVHGQNYTGPNWEKELKDAKEVLKREAS